MSLHIQAVLAAPGHALEQRELQWTAPGTAESALVQLGWLHWLEPRPGATLALMRYGRSCPLDTVLEDGDRLELVGPLLGDPKERRRERVNRLRRQPRLSA